MWEKEDGGKIIFFFLENFSPRISRLNFAKCKTWDREREREIGWGNLRNTWAEICLKT